MAKAFVDGNCARYEDGGWMTNPQIAPASPPVSGATQRDPTSHSEIATP
jgi:hypothetical protein